MVNKLPLLIVVYNVLCLFVPKNHLRVSSSYDAFIQNEWSHLIMRRNFFFSIKRYSQIIIKNDEDNDLSDNFPLIQLKFYFLIIIHNGCCHVIISVILSLSSSSSLDNKNTDQQMNHHFAYRNVSFCLKLRFGKSWYFLRLFLFIIFLATCHVK